MKNFYKKLIKNKIIIWLICLLPMTLQAMEWNFQLGGAVSSSKEKGGYIDSGELVWGNLLLQPQKLQTKYIKTLVGLNFGIEEGAASSKATQGEVFKNTQYRSQSFGLRFFFETLPIASNLSFYVSPAISSVTSNVSYNMKKLLPTSQHIVSMSYLDTDYRGLSYETGLGIVYNLFSEVRVVAGLRFAKSSLKRKKSQQKWRTQSKASLSSPKLTLTQPSAEVMQAPAKLRYQSLGFQVGLSLGL